MLARKLETDAEITAAYNEAKTSENIGFYWREGSEGGYENNFLNDHGIEAVLDATCHGFEFIAVETPEKPDFIEEDELEFADSVSLDR